jgi:hypothetical protein
MKRIEYFTFRPISDELLAPCIVVPKDYDTFPIKAGNGSYNVAPARVLGLDYPTYLRFLRDSFPDVVTLVGKGHRYAHPVWKRGSRELSVFIKLLNDKMMIAMQGVENK